MPCYHPITAYQANPGEPLLFADPKWGATDRGGGYRKLEISCGKCTGCRLKRSREWATRCMHEKLLHKHNCSITLTYDDKKTDPGYSLVHRDFQLFIKRLRKALGKEVKGNDHHENTNAFLHGRHGALPHTPGDIKYYMCGEYGGLTSRPHFHACIFGVDFADKLYHKKTPAGQKIYVSKTLDALWGNGFGAIGEVTFESAAYIARYIMQKYDWGEKYDEIIDPETGEIMKRIKQYNQMSRGNRLKKDNAIGAAWLNQFQNDAYPHGKVVLRNHKVPTPRYYDKKFKKIDKLAYEQLQYMRYLEQIAQQEHHTLERLAVQEYVKEHQLKSLQRSAQ